MQVFIDTKQTRLTVRNNSFFIKNSTTNRIISPHRITSIAITSNALIILGSNLNSDSYGLENIMYRKFAA